MISAAASAPPQSSSNKRISFNLVTAGASQCTAADLSSEKALRPPTLKSRYELSDLWKFQARPPCGARRRRHFHNASSSSSFSFFF